MSWRGGHRGASAPRRRAAAAVAAAALVAVTACGASADDGARADRTTLVGTASPGSVAGTSVVADPAPGSAGSIVTTTLAPGAPPGPGLPVLRGPTTRAPAGALPTTTATTGPAGNAATTTVLTVDPAQVTAGEGVTLTAVSRAEGAAELRGSVVFFEGSTAVGATVLDGGRATVVVRSSTPGNHTYVARYSGSAGFAPSTSAPVDVTVDAELFPPPPGPGEYGYYPQTIPPYDGAGPKVVLVGDSITYYDSYWFVTAAKAAGFSVGYTGMPGYRLSMFKPWIDLWAATGPKVVIVNLGTNDITGDATGNPNFTLDLFEKRMDVLAKELAHRCLVVTTFTSHRTMVGSNPPTDGYTPDQFNALAREYNAYLRSSFAHVADWDAVVADHPEYLPDGVHPLNSAEGLTALADLQVKAAQGCP